MSDDMDEIWELFADDGAQALNAMEAALLALQDGSAADPAAEIGALFRAVHTFKGNSRVLGLSTVENRAHLSEDLIGLVRDQGVPLNADILDVLLLSCDTLRSMLETTAATRADVDPAPSETLTERLREVIAQSADPGEPAIAAPNPGKIGAIANALAALEDESDDDADHAASTAPHPMPAADGRDPAAVETPSADHPDDAVPVPRTDAPRAAGPRLSDDPGYREIFEGIARKTMEKLDSIAAADAPDLSDAAARCADQLAFAAQRMELDAWQARIDPFVARAKAANGIDVRDITELVADIDRLLGAGIAPAVEPIAVDANDAADDAASGAPDDWDDLPTGPDHLARPDLVAADPEPNPAPVTAATDSAPTPSRRTDDPVYCEIFNGMVEDTVTKLEKLVAACDPYIGPKAARLLDQLSYAAQQMGLDDWQARVDPVAMQAKAGTGDTPAAITDLVADLGRMLACGLGNHVDAAVPDALPESVGFDEPVPGPGATVDSSTAPASNDVQFSDGAHAASGPVVPARIAEAGAAAPAPGSQDFLVEVQAFYTRMSEIGLQYREPDGNLEPHAQDRLCDALGALAAAHGYVGLGAVIDALRAARDGESYRVAELELYEALVRIERMLPNSDAIDAMLPSRLLETWCADSIYDTLVQLRETLDALKHDECPAARFGHFERLMRLVYHACNHFRMDTAAQLSMALLDLFSRVKLANVPPDAILLHIARGYVETLELVFDALEQGDTPDLADINQLFEAASNACFTSSGVVSARSIETRLNLPESFHRVLSPDSVRAAQTAIDERMTFYIVRADLNRDQQKAEAFLDWFGTGQVRMITNVTVFTEDDVLFDFLLASRMDTPRIVEALATIDPSGRNLELVQTLMPAQEPQCETSGGQPDPTVAEQPLSSTANANTIELIEMIGEMAAGQAMVHHMLSALSGRDLVHEMEMALREAGVDLPGPQVWRALRDRVEDYGDTLLQVANAEAQLTEQVSRIQEAGVALRSRSAHALLQSLAAFVETRSRGLGKEARLSSEGGDLALDQTILEEMRTHMRALLTMRISGPTPPTRYHVAVMREDDGVIITLDDDGGPLPDDRVVDEIAQELAQRSGSLRVSEPPTGGLRFHLMLPLNMMVLDGMVVRVADVRYVVPLDAIQRIQMCGPRDVLHISADGHTRMLRVSETEHIPIHDLQGARLLPVAPTRVSDDRLYVIVRSAARHVALPVDELLGQQMVLLRPLRGVLSRMRGLTGIALLAGGDVGMVLSVSRLDAA